jgi:asparagine synthase (glutamine-hydrolysing)
MCGIIGQLRLDGRAVEADLPARMCKGLEHRGPDARGIHQDGPVALGIQRLRVIDLATGDQPIYNEDRTVAVVLNGEIYNYGELREELLRRGHTLTTHGDTEVIAHLYEELGVDCVRRLHGMFAFALWDTRRRRLVVARDRLGKKPIVYSLRNGAISFASEMGALLADAEIPREVDLEALDAYLAHGYVPAPLTALRGVRKLPAAHTLVVEDGAVKIERYWQLDYATKLEGVPVEELCERIRAGLLDATRKRMIADVPLGAFLSGGIDSSAVVAAMARQSSEPVRTFSIGFDHEEFDELPHARRVSQQYGTIHEEFQVRAEAIEILPRIVRHYGEPFADSSAIPSFYLSELTRRHVTVALNGDGGDESFGGYTRYVANALAGRLDRLPRSARRAVGALTARLPEDGHPSSVRSRARRLGASLGLDAPGRYGRYMAWFDADQRRALYGPELAAACTTSYDAIADAWAETSGASVIDKMLEVDVATYLAGDLIPKIDIATMAHALEARSPFLDHELMQLAASIPANLKVRGSEKKWILREALRDWLPGDLLDRPKQGFSVPLSSWLRTDLRAWARDVLLDPATLDRGYFRRDAVEGLLDRHVAGVDAEDHRIWSLLMLELWHREYIDAPAADLRDAA